MGVDELLEGAHLGMAVFEMRLNAVLPLEQLLAEGTREFGGFPALVVGVSA